MTTTTLTDRYVAAVVRGLPDAQRADLAQELRASIADSIDDRVEAGAEPHTAEREVITELGDPIVLAAGYTGSPLHLIGPALFADWKRLLTLLEFIVVPIVLATLTVVGLLKGDAPLDAIGSAVWTAIVVATQLAFWVTAAFAVVERLPGMRGKKLAGWNPDMLPESSAQLTSPTEFVLETTFGALFITAFALSPFVSPFSDATGAPISFFDPWIWQTGLVAVLIIVPLLQIGANAIKLRGHWTLPLAIGAIIVDLVGGGAIIVLGATGHVLNPAFVEAAGWPDVVPTIVNIAAVGVGVLTLATSTWENLRPIRRA